MEQNWFFFVFYGLSEMKHDAVSGSLHKLEKNVPMQFVNICLLYFQNFETFKQINENDI